MNDLMNNKRLIKEGCIKQSVDESFRNRFVLLAYEDGVQISLREYPTLKDVFKDIFYKDPACFFIGDNSNMTAHSFENFISEFSKYLDLSCSNCVNYDEWYEFEEYGGLVNECRTCNMFCYPLEYANHCTEYKEKEKI